MANLCIASHSHMWGMDCPPPAAGGLAMAQTEDHPHIIDDRTCFFWQYEDADPNFSQLPEFVEFLELVLTPDEHWYFDWLGFIKDIHLRRILEDTSNTNVEFLVSSSELGGLDIEICSSIVHIPNHCSVQNEAVQMLLYAKLTKGQRTFRCPRSLARRAIIDIAKKSNSDDCSTVLPTVRQISADSVLSQEPEEEECNFKNPKTHALASPVDASCSSSAGTLATVILLDSGAGHHAVGDAGILTDLHDPPAGSTVIVADGFQLPVDKMGVIQTPDIRIPDVYLVPGLEVNLVSVRQLAKSNVVTTFYENHAELWREGEQVGGAIADNDTSLYRLCFFRPSA